VKITIESTDKITTLDGVRARLWNGVTESGVPCLVFVSRLAVANGEDQSQFERELAETPPPREVAARSVFEARTVL
jgi:hypothetical protein